MRPFTVAFLGMSLLGCGEEAPSVGGGPLDGTWQGVSASGLPVTMQIEHAAASGIGGPSSVQGVLSVGDERCLRQTALAGVLTGDVLHVSAVGVGRGSRQTFIDVSGLVRAGGRIDATLSMTGDRQLEACEMDRTPLTLERR